MAAENGDWGSGSSPLISTKRKQDQHRDYETYRGSVTVSGEWFIFDQRELGDPTFEVCFSVAAKDQSLIPRPTNDARSAWFCFNRSNTIMKELGVTQAMLQSLNAYEICQIKGTARVAVESYIRYNGESEGYDTATLLKIYERGKPRVVPAKDNLRDIRSCDATN